MTYPVTLDHDAQAEFDTGYDYYAMRRLAAAEEFADAVQIVLTRIGKTPRLHQAVFGEVRRAIVRGFPYCVYYREEQGRVRVIAVFHTSRDPSIWQSRI